MEEKNLNEAQVAEQTTSQDENKNTADYKKLYEEQTANLGDAEDCVNRLNEDNERLMAENADLIEKLKSAEASADFSRKRYIEYLTQRDILKATLESICVSHNISKAEMYAAMMESNSIDLDVLLGKLSN